MTHKGLPESILVECGPVRNGPIQSTHVDQVKFIIGVDPDLCCIVDLESEIGGDKARLDWGKIGADDLGGGIFIGKVAVFR